MQRALAAQTAGELDAARELYEQVVACAPQTFDALHMLGVVLYQQGRLADAYVNIRRALELTDWRNAKGQEKYNGASVGFLTELSPVK